MPLETALELPVFTGPLDLLLDLIERRRLDVTNVSLAAVADQYLEAVHALPEPDPDVLGEFLIIATRLLLLKSRTLLPQVDEADQDETVDDLAERLEEYRRFKEAAHAMAARFETGERAFPHSVRPELESVQPALAPIEPDLLAQLWRTIARRQPPTPRDREPEPPRAQVADRLLHLRTLIAVQTSLRWEEVAGSTVDELIATFLAVLELVRRGEVDVRQDTLFGSIQLARGRTPIPANGQAGSSEPEQLG